MNFKHLKISLFSLTILASSTAFSQETNSESSIAPFSPAKSFRTWSIGVNAGALAPIAPFGKNDYTNWETDLGYGAYIKKQLSHNFSLQANFLRGKLNATNENQLGNGSAPSSPYQSFETEIHSAISLAANVNLGQFYWMNRKSSITPYLTGGAGLMSYATTLTNNAGVSSEYTPDKNVNEVFYPVGGGLKIGLSKSINLDLAYTMNFVDADNLDGYHSGPQNDKFSYAFAGLEFALGSKSKPQLATYNPAAALEYDYIKRNKELADQVAAAGL